MLTLTALLLVPMANVASDPIPAAALYSAVARADERPGFSYTYVEANYLWLDSDAADDSLDGGELTGSLELPLNLFLQATYSTLSGDADLDQLRVGAGWHFSLGDLLDAYGVLSFVDQEFDSGIDDEQGVAGDAGVRLMLTRKIEVSGYGEWADIESSDVGFGAAARFYMTPSLSVGARALMIDSGDEWAAGLRFQL